jgi:RES domain-containing protein
VILYRCFAWNEGTRENQPDGPLWFPQVFQGEGRHDNPDIYGCLYLADRPLSCIVEQFGQFRGQRLTPTLLRRRGLPLGLAEIELDDGAKLINLDDPSVLHSEGLRPSAVATRRRGVTQPQARQLYERHTDVAGLAWWSIYEALWMNVTLFDRAGPLLRLRSVRVLKIVDPALVEAADYLFGGIEKPLPPTRRT